MNVRLVTLAPAHHFGHSVVCNSLKNVKMCNACIGLYTANCDSTNGDFDT